MEHFLEVNSLYVVLGIVLIIWAGLAVYLFMVEKKLNKLEANFDLENNGATTRE